MNKLNILHVTNYVGRQSFGLGPVILNLSEQQLSMGHNVKNYCYDYLSGLQLIKKKHNLNYASIQQFPTVGPKRLGFSPALEREIFNKAQEFDIIHQHGIWTGISRAVNKWRAITERPTIVAPHGSLKSWALRRSRWKKRLALILYEQQNLNSVSCMHALSIQEAADFRRYGLTKPTAVLPNGISYSWILQDADPARFRARYGLSQNLRIMLFLGRITPIKGLPLLLQAMHNCRELLEEWRLVIAGVDEFNHQREVQRLVEHLGLQTFVIFVGSQFDQDKSDAFAAADLFVLPSHSEGAPVAILEALGASVPVLTTKASPWEELVTHQCGWWTDISVEAIKDALEDALRRSSTELKEMGQRGKKLVSEKYTWPQIAEQTLALYEWLLHGGSTPDFVILD